MQHICEFSDMWHMRHNFHICDFENAEKYATTYSHITSIPSQYVDNRVVEIESTRNDIRKIIYRLPNKNSTFH